MKTNSSSSSSSWRYILALLIPLLTVSYVYFGVDSRFYNTWPPSSSSSSSSSLNNSTITSGSSSSVKGEEEHEKYHMDATVEEESESAINKANYTVPNSSSNNIIVNYGVLPHISPTPSPAPQPAEGNIEDNIVKDNTSKKTRASKLQQLEHGLSKARAAIREAVRNPNAKELMEDQDYVPQGPIYRNANAFQRSYLEMEKLFKVYVYEEGEPPLFHDGPCKSIYSMEGRFIYTMELGNNFRTRDPDQAHVFFLPFSVVKMVKFIYKQKSFDIEPLKRTIADYINVVGDKYPFWNRSLGADHFMLSCHDWGPVASAATPHLNTNSIRVLCNANASEGFKPYKDVSLPEINLQTGLTAGIIGGPSPSHRPFLAFFAGGLHGYIRSLLLTQWQGKDEDVQVHQYLPKGVSYYDMMRKSKFCLCPSGYEVASPRIVEAIYLECVPVIISDNYVLPFSDVLNWRAFSVIVKVKDIPNLKSILMNVSSRQYIRMQRRVKLVQKHFVVNYPPEKFDVFHMILHSIWLRRLNIKV